MQTVSQKGQMVLPAGFRQAFQIGPKTLVLVIPDLDKQEIVVRPLKTTDPVTAGYGLLSGGKSLTKALLQEKKQEKRLEEKKYARIFGSW